MLSSASRTSPVWRLAVISLGMSGLRLDRHAGRVPRVALFAGVVVLYYLAAPPAVTPSVACWYAATVWVLYYGGLSLVLGGPGRRRLIGRFGEARAYAIYEVALGVLFLNQGFAQAVIIYAFGDSLPDVVPVWASCLAGGILMVVGLSCKTWAAYATGLDVYYCRDMFLGGAVPGELTTSGPYRYLRNPMYSVGNLHAYGWAVWSRSLEGIVFAMIFQLGIYAFYHFFERPFIRRVHLRATATRDSA
ncbi:PEMT/PEM2 methyltransferase family protein [Nonomuraea sp. NPDC049152]|uniref:PEMT/PEM2 family methyltransferase n=1 Tax=Nonomuraea sp. NPDC049152 TaxID=3154350 RepID=UPI00340619EA